LQLCAQLACRSAQLAPTYPELTGRQKIVGKLVPFLTVRHVMDSVQLETFAREALSRIACRAIIIAQNIHAMSVTVTATIAVSLVNRNFGKNQKFGK